MIQLLISASATIMLFILVTIMRRSMTWDKYAGIFLLCSGFLFWFASANASEDFYEGRAQFEIKQICHELDLTYRCDKNTPKVKVRPREASYNFIEKYVSLTSAQTNEYKKYIEYHHDKAVGYFCDAEEICWYLPDVDDKESARYCFTAAIALLASGSPISKACAAVLTTMTNYGLDAMEDWNMMKTLIHKAQYHSEMEQFYAELLIKGNQ